jgi:hypothetical protein
MATKQGQCGEASREAGLTCIGGWTPQHAWDGTADELSTPSPNDAQVSCRLIVIF